MQVIKNINLNSHGVRRLGAASLDMCHVAKGIVEGFWEYNLQPWDTAAGNIIILKQAELFQMKTEINIILINVLSLLTKSAQRFFKNY